MLSALTRAISSYSDNGKVSLYYYWVVSAYGVIWRLGARGALIIRHARIVEHTEPSPVAYFRRPQSTGIMETVHEAKRNSCPLDSCRFGVFFHCCHVRSSHT